MALTEFVVNAPGVKQILVYLYAWLKNDRELRLLRSQNAAAPAYEQNVTVTDAAIYTIPGTSNLQQDFSMLIVMTDQASGKGRFLTSGRRPTPTGQGSPFPSGGAIVPVRGNDQIRKFQLVAETGETLNVWWGLYQ
jgi:hypothetical protein